MAVLVLEVLVGMIGSGKSLYARIRARQGALVINHDDLTSMLHAEYRYEQGLKPCYRRMMMELAAIGLEAGRDVVIDRTHLTRESRQLWVRFAREQQQVQVKAIVFPREPAAIHASRRYVADPRGRTREEWQQVALHQEQLADSEPILADEGFDQISGPDLTRPEDFS